MLLTIQPPKKIDKKKRRTKIKKTYKPTNQKKHLVTFSFVLKYTTGLKRKKVNLLYNERIATVHLMIARTYIKLFFLHCRLLLHIYIALSPWEVTFLLLSRIKLLAMCLFWLFLYIPLNIYFFISTDTSEDNSVSAYVLCLHLSKVHLLKIQIYDWPLVKKFRTTFFHWCISAVRWDIYPENIYIYGKTFFP